MHRIGDAGETTIGTMSELYGVSLRSLRFYEERGMLRPRRDGTARFYGPKDRTRLEVILKGKKLGFSLSEIHDLIDAHQAKDVSDIEDGLPLDVVERQVEALLAKRAELDEGIGRLQSLLARMRRDPKEAEDVAAVRDAA